MISDYIDVNAPKHLITDRKLVGANPSKHGKNTMAAQGSTFIRRQAGMTQTMANNFLNQSQDSQQNNRSNRSSINRENSNSITSRDRMGSYDNFAENNA